MKVLTNSDYHDSIDYGNSLCGFHHIFIITFALKGGLQMKFKLIFVLLTVIFLLSACTDANDADQAAVTDGDLSVEAPRGSLDDLEKEYPDLFGLDTSEGLTVYVWKPSEASYSCRLVGSSDSENTPSKITESLYGCDIVTMRKILFREYDVKDEDVEVIFIDHPLSEYKMPKRPKKENKIFAANLRSILGLDGTDSDKYGPLHGVYIGDIDKDGVEEACTLYWSTLSGMSGFAIDIIENGEIEYKKYFYSPHFIEMRFVRRDGEVKILGMEYTSIDDKVGKEYIYDLIFEDGDLKLYGINYQGVKDYIE